MSAMLDSLSDQLKDYGPLVLRAVMAVVYFYFGTAQLSRPEAWVGWLPAEAALLPISARNLIILNGAFETFCACLLIVGLFTRIASLLVGLHLLAITFSIGWTEIGVRDLGLSIGTIAIALMGGGALSLDNYFSAHSELKSLPEQPPPEQPKQEDEPRDPEQLGGTRYMEA